MPISSVIQPADKLCQVTQKHLKIQNKPQQSIKKKRSKQTRKKKMKIIITVKGMKSIQCKLMLDYKDKEIL